MSCKITEHHVIPQSRGGTKTVGLPRSFHEAWHALFQDLKPQEIEMFICIMNRKMKEERVIDQKEINKVIRNIKEVSR